MDQSIDDRIADSFADSFATRFSRGAMTYIEYELFAECSDEEMEDKLRQLRATALALPMAKVEKVIKFDPFFNEMTIQVVRQNNIPLPPEVQKRFDDHNHVSHPDEPWMPFQIFPGPRDNLKRAIQYMQPVRDYLKTKPFRESDLPEKLYVNQRIPYGICWRRPAILLDFARVMLCYGYSLEVSPDEAVRDMQLVVSAFRADRTPVWYGFGRVTTLHANNFTRAHETTCALLDRARELGLLHRVRDECGFFKHRDWRKAAPIVQRELRNARLDAEINKAFAAAFAEEGLPIKVVGAPEPGAADLVMPRGDVTPPGRKKAPSAKKPGAKPATGKAKTARQAASRSKAATKKNAASPKGPAKKTAASTNAAQKKPPRAKRDAATSQAGKTSGKRAAPKTTTPRKQAAQQQPARKKAARKKAARKRPPEPTG